MTAGKMRHRIKFQQPVMAVDAGGGYVQIWKDIAFYPEVFATMETISAYERFDNRQLTQRATHRFIVRYRDDLTAEMRIVKGDNVYKVAAVIDRMESKRYLEILTIKTESA